MNGSSDTKTALPIVMGPLEFMDRLAALVPRPRFTSDPLPWSARTEREIAQ